MSKIKIGEDSAISKIRYLKIRRRDGVESLTTLEKGKFEVPIDGCINRTKKQYAEKKERKVDPKIVVPLS